MSGSGDLKVVSATRDNEGGYLEQLLAKLALAEREAEQYRRAWEQAEAEIDRMAHQLQRAHDQGFVIDDAPAPPSSGTSPAPVCDAADPPPAAAEADAAASAGRSWWRQLSCAIVSLRFCCRN